MSEMIERMARAYYERYFADLIPRLEHPWDRVPTDHKERMLGAARAAIEAMREPPREMFEYFGSGEAAKWAPGIWECMIDAALKPTQPASEVQS